MSLWFENPHGPLRSRPLLTPTQISDLGKAYRQRLESLLAIDEGVARIINALQAAGVLQNTLVIYTSDNGWFQGEHRIGFGKILPYESAVKVPLLIPCAGRRPGTAGLSTGCQHRSGADDRGHGWSQGPPNHGRPEPMATPPGSGQSFGPSGRESACTPSTPMVTVSSTI
jgi:hypothetical protein